VNAAIIIGALWVVASAIVAFLPMKHQYVPGIMLLALAPVLIIWLAFVYGLLVGAVALFAFVSMFRNPLIYIYRRLRGETPEVPKCHFH
jgi:hypothetical protein